MKASARAVWIGDDTILELALARAGVEEVLHARGECLEAFRDPRSAVATSADPGGDAAATPRLALLATDQPARWTLADAVRLSLAWPLMPIVSVAASLVDGRRRSGPALPGVEEVAWHELPGRLDRWLAAWDRGVPGVIGLPATTRRDERLLAMEAVDSHVSATPVSVVAATPIDADGIADMVEAAGGSVAAKACGKPRLDAPAAVLIWDAGRLSPEGLAWLRLLSANRPALQTIMLESFPRGDSVQAALDAGAAAVLGRPLSLEALGGTLSRLHRARMALGKQAGLASIPADVVPRP